MAVPRTDPGDATLILVLSTPVAEISAGENSDSDRKKPISGKADFSEFYH